MHVVESVMRNWIGKIRDNRFLQIRGNLDGSGIPGAPPNGI